MNIGIYIYDEAEVLDFSGPFEVFSTATRVSKSSGIFNVFLIGETGNTIKARGGFNVSPAFGFLNHPAIDVLIVVGGVHQKEMQKPNVISWINEQSKKSKFVTSVCTGAFLLAEARVITSQNVTTHWEDIAGLRKSYPTLNVIENQRWVEDGNIITSAGISAGIDMSLHLLSKISTQETAISTAKQMEFDWRKN